MTTEKREKQVLLLSFFAGLAFAVAEFIFSIYSHSQSALTDAVYDLSELVFIALLLFLTPLFHRPVSEKHPYGYFQVESIFVIIKGVMMLSVTVSVSASVIDSALSGGNAVNNAQVSLFQFVLGCASAVIFLVMRRLNRNLSSPTVAAELLGWKLDVAYSLGMSLAFFVSLKLEGTALAFLMPYFDQIVAVLVMVFMLPESVKVLWGAVREVFLFSPEPALMEEIKEVCRPILEAHHFSPLFYDVTKTGRHLWVAVYFQIESGSLGVDALSEAWEAANAALGARYPECSCELILTP
ncbi:cation transporter [Intestinimonas sp.]|uniref:cation transporter n=1 Tax=Intestinimonas sp. TaxID=1965293 RepID=UPI002634F9BD|nr:cation transporter [Intestinimonas sp.]